MDEDICPPYWSELLWWLHHHGPINYPPEVDRVMAALSMHSLSYLLANQADATRLRAELKTQLVTAVEGLGAHASQEKG